VLLYRIEQDLLSFLVVFAQRLADVSSNNKEIHIKGK